jgi:hypothetical protein
MSTWKCVEQCGACCHLDPRDRPDLASYLSPAELAEYLELVSESGWCQHYDRATRKCTIYAERPRFCRVKPETFEQMYQVKPEEFNDFAIACCCEQIAGVYGDDSIEMQRYGQAIAEAEQP